MLLALLYFNSLHFLPVTLSIVPHSLNHLSPNIYPCRKANSQPPIDECSFSTISHANFHAYFGGPPSFELFVVKASIWIMFLGILAEFLAVFAFVGLPLFIARTGSASPTVPTLPAPVTSAGLLALPTITVRRIVTFRTSRVGYKCIFLIIGCMLVQHLLEECIGVGHCVGIIVVGWFRRFTKDTYTIRSS